MKSAKWTDLRVLQWSLILQLISFSFVFISTCTANRKADQAKIDRHRAYFLSILAWFCFPPSTSPVVASFKGEGVFKTGTFSLGNFS